MNFLRSAAEPRVLPRPLGSVRGPAGHLCNPSVRIIQATGAVPAPPATHLSGDDRVQHSPRICLGIPIASRQEQRHEDAIRLAPPSQNLFKFLITPNWPEVMSSVAGKEIWPVAERKRLSEEWLAWCRWDAAILSRPYDLSCWTGQ